MKYYIIGTRKSSKNPNSVSEIEGYKITYVENDGYFRAINAKYYDKGTFFRMYYDQKSTYRTHNFHTGEGSNVKVYKSVNNEYYFKSDPDNSKSDNLLRLPDC